jgi:hypothetical protein
MLNDYCRRLFKHQDAYYFNEARASLYLNPQQFPALAVRWYLAARIERERAKSA